jgi:hypothetical protein
MPHSFEYIADPKSQCFGKHPFKRASDARKVARRGAIVAQVYRCPHCGQFHIGHAHERRTRRRPQPSPPPINLDEYTE